MPTSCRRRFTSSRGAIRDTLIRTAWGAKQHGSRWTADLGDMEALVVSRPAAHRSNGNVLYMPVSSDKFLNRVAGPNSGSTVG